MNASASWVQMITQNCTNLIASQTESVDIEQLRIRYRELTSAEREAVHNIICTQFEAVDAIFVLSYIVDQIRLDDFWSDIAFVAEDSSIDAIYGTMLECQIRINNKLAYKEILKLHRVNVGKYIREFGRLEYIPNESRNSNIIIIITEQILGILHAPTAMVCETSYCLKKMGYKVIIFQCPENRTLPQELWFGKTFGYNGERMGCSEIKYKDDIFSLYSYPMGKCEMKDYKDMIDKIYTLRPGIVICMGLDNPIGDAISSFTTVAYRNMTVDFPITTADVIVRTMRRGSEEEREFENLLLPYQKQIFPNNVFPAVINKSEKKYTRKALDVPEDKFLIAIVGNRLNEEINAEFQDILLQMKAINDNIYYVIIGKKWALELDDRLIKCTSNIGYQEDLLEVCKIMNLYLNPNRLGGGWSSEIALAAGIPVVTLPECDVSDTVGEEFTVGTYEEMIDIVTRYVNDREFYALKKKKAIEIGTRRQEQGGKEYIGEIINEVMEAIDNG